MENEIQVLIPGKRLNRWIAIILDSFFLGLIELPFLFVSELIILGTFSFDDKAVEKTLSNPIVLTFVLLLLGLYNIGFLYYKGATPGKNWRKIKVVQSNSGNKITLFQTIAREVSKMVYYIPVLGTLLYLISAGLVLFSKRRRALHDFISGTIVINQ